MTFSGKKMLALLEKISWMSNIFVVQYTIYFGWLAMHRIWVPEEQCM